MRPIPHTNKTEGEDADERVRLTTRRERRETETEELDDDETWLAVQEF